MAADMTFDFPDPLTVDESPDHTFIFPSPPEADEPSNVPASPSEEQDSLSQSLSWSMVEPSDQSYEHLSEDDAASSVSAPSPRLVRSVVLAPSIALSDWGSDVASLEFSSHSDDGSSSWGSQSVPNVSVMQGMFRARFKDVQGRGAALEWFLSQDFLEGTSKPPTGYLDSKSADTSNSSRYPPGPVRRVFPNFFIAGSSRDHRQDAYYHILLRRRRIHSKYRNRELEAKGKKPDSDWRWCGFANCQDRACAYGETSEDQQVLVPRDLYSKRKMFISLLAGFEDSFQGELDPHILVAFTISPPISRALADCVCIFAAENGDSQAPSSFEDEVQQGVSEFLTIISRMADLSSIEETNLHKRMEFETQDRRTANRPDLVFEFMMHAEAWRRRQTENGYPWTWPPDKSAELFKVILQTYQDLINAGEVVLKDEPEGNAQDKMWRVWLETYRPWNDCKVNLLSDIEAAEVKEDRASDPSVYEGVGLSLASWWPNQSRAPACSGKGD